jgi:hypothetical protein
MIKLLPMAIQGGSDFAWWNSSSISIGQKPNWLAQNGNAGSIW